VYAKTLLYFSIFILLIGTALSLFGREIIFVLATPTYESAFVVLPWLIYSNIAWGVVGIVGIACEIAKKSYQVTVATVLGAAVTTGLNIILIPEWGVRGGASAMMTGNLVALIYIYLIGQRYFFVSYELLKLFRVTMLSVFVISIGLVFDTSPGLNEAVIVAIKAVLFMFFIVSLFVLRTIELRQIKEALVKLEAPNAFMMRLKTKLVK
jgi:O-antigen/teichoic acid export membrane protein